MRVLDAGPVTGLDRYTSDGGGKALEAARAVAPEVLVDAVEASGLRGRGGAGFPTGVKWRTVAGSRPTGSRLTVVVNAAEGEPGCFKDRELLRRNPYRVLEGALVAARAVGADGVVVAAKASFRPELDRIRTAIAEMKSAGWTDGVEVFVAEGPDAYLFGEETGLLEVIAGRPPFPRVAPPFRHGLEAGADTAEPARVPMAGEGGEVPPTLVDNVETLANVPGIVLEGPERYRETGTDGSPGTVICTVSGAVPVHGVAEFPMGTPLREVIATIGGRNAISRVRAVISGVANPVLPADLLDTPVSYEGMEAAGAGLGAAGFIVIGRDDDIAAVAHGIARFLAVESCGQCEPCKRDGLAITDHLERIRNSKADETDLVFMADRAATVADGARCYLAHQTQRVVESVLRLFPDDLREHVAGGDPAEPYLVAPIVDIVDGHAVLDDRHAAKQPDWSYDPVDSGTWPANRIDTAADT